MISTLETGAKTFYHSSSYTPPVQEKSTNFLRGTFAVLTTRERRRFLLLIGLDILVSFFDIASIALLLWIVQFYLQPGRSHLPSFVSNRVFNQGSVTLIAVFFLLFTVKNLAAFLISRFQYMFVGKVAVRISKDNLENYQRSPYQQFVEVDSSVHLRKIAYQPFDFCQYMLCGAQQIITQSSLIALTIVGILWFNARLFLLLLLILLPPVVGVFYYIKERLTRAKRHIKQGNEKSFQYLMDALKGYVEGNIYGRNKFFLQRFVEQRKAFSDHLFDSLSVQTLPSRLIEVFAVMGLFILIMIARWGGSNDSESLITIGAFMAAAYKIIPGIVRIVNTASQIKAYEFSLDEIVDRNSRLDKRAKVVGRIESLTLENLEFSYGNNYLIRNLSLDARKGDFIGIMGRSGKGKTSLLNLCLGFLQPSRGAICVNGIAVNAHELKDYWPNIAYVRQQPFLIHDSIARNIKLEEDGDVDDVLLSVLDTVGLNELMEASGTGRQSIVTENGKNISGGQQQRITIARALYKDADLILLDEPFNELDEGSELILIRHFQKLAQNGKIVLMVTHNRRALSFCNKIVCVDEE